MSRLGTGLAAIVLALFLSFTLSNTAHGVTAIGVKYPREVIRAYAGQAVELEFHVYNWGENAENLYVTIGTLTVEVQDEENENKWIPVSKPWENYIFPSKENFTVGEQTIEANFFLPRMDLIESPVQPEVPAELTLFADVCTLVLENRWAPARRVTVVVTPPEGTHRGNYRVKVEVSGRTALAGGSMVGGSVGAEARLLLYVVGPPPPIPVRLVVLLVVLVVVVAALIYVRAKRGRLKV
ncbi:MAG: hypothetical protein QXR87_05080 [Candidatus Hadarchaeales archaeon]